MTQTHHVSLPKLLVLTFLTLLSIRSKAGSYRNGDYSHYQKIKLRGKGWTYGPTPSPSPQPSSYPSSLSPSPSLSPSSSPSSSPSASSSASPSTSPFASPSASPSTSPSASPSVSPSVSLSASPSSPPSRSPSVSVSLLPSHNDSNPDLGSSNNGSTDGNGDDATFEGADQDSDDKEQTPSITTVQLGGKSRSGVVSGMIAGIIAITTLFGLVYHRSRKERTREMKYHVSEFYNNNDIDDEDANPNHLWPNSPTSSLRQIAEGSATVSGSNDSDDRFSQVSTSNWNWMTTSMSKLAAGATQEGFSQNGMTIDMYGQNQNRKKKKRGSPVTHGKKGSELDTTLEPIVEVNSSLAGSVINQTDDKMIKGNFRVPGLLPALSISSCPSDENNYRSSTYSPVDVPALEAITPDPLMDELMTPSNAPMVSTTLKQYTQAMENSYEGSPVRKLNFTSLDTDGNIDLDKSSDSGVQELLAYENRANLSEEESLRSSLISFVDSYDDESPRKEENDEEMIRKTLGIASDFEDKENSPPIKTTSDNYNATVLVLSRDQKISER